MSSLLKSRATLQLENQALHHQIGILQRSAKKRPKLTSVDRFFWAWLSKVWTDWRFALVIVKPETAIAWLSAARQGDRGRAAAGLEDRVSGPSLRLGLNLNKRG